VVQDAQDMLGVYMDTIRGLKNAIQRKPRKVFHLQKLGSTILFAVNESRRLLAIYASSEVKYYTAHNLVVNFALEPRANHPIRLRGSKQQPYGQRRCNHDHTVVR
jgi:hypothetical protein